METAAPLLVTSDSDLYITTAELKTNASNPSGNNTDDYELYMPGIVYVAITSSLEIPIICLSIYAVYGLIKSEQAAPVFVINLLIIDLIQIIFILLFITLSLKTRIITVAVLTWAGVTGSYFMACIAVERYVLIAHPVWHRSHRSVKCLVCTSLTGWLVSLIIFPMFFIDEALPYFMALIFYAVIIVCFVGSCRSLSHSVSLTPLKKQLVLGPLFFVVMSYTFLILPINIVTIIDMYLEVDLFLIRLWEFTASLYALNPLVDCLLYVFMRSDADNIIRTPLCCSRLKRVQTETGQTTSTDVQSDHV